MHMIPYGKIPKSYKDINVHYVTCKNTIYGIHRHVYWSPAVDFSKTTIICFTDRRHALMFKEELWKLQQSGKVLDRCMDGVSVMYPYVDKKTKGGMIAMGTDSTNIVNIMKMCHLNFFDMNLVFDFNKIDDNSQVSSYTMSYYEFRTNEMPNRAYIDLCLEKLLY